MKEPTAPIGYRLAKTIGGRLVRRLYDLRVGGLEHVPEHGPAILAANHRSFTDSLFLAAVVDRPIRFLAKAEYFDHRRTAWMFRAVGQIPVRRGSAAGARNALRRAREVLDGGGILGIFPEGTRSRDGALHEGTEGAAWLAAASGAALIPVGISGTEAVQPPERLLPAIAKPVDIRFGSPIPPRPQGRRPRQRHLVTAQLMATIGSLAEDSPPSVNT